MMFALRGDVDADQFMTEADHAFIRRARTRWPAALNEIERLNEVIDSDEKRIDALIERLEQFQADNASLRAQIAGHAEK